MKAYSVKREADRLLEAQGGPCAHCNSNEHESTGCPNVSGSLASIDELIAATSQKLELLKRHRRGLVQRFARQGARPAQPPRTDEGRFASLAAAGMIGAAALHPGARSFAKKVFHPPAQQAAQRFLANDPSEPLPSEKNLSDWDYVEKKDAERGREAKALAPATQRYFYGNGA